MKKAPSVTFQEPPSPVRAPEEPLTTRMRYSQLLKSMAGGSMISGQSSDTAAEHIRRAFDSAAVPAKPAMKQSPRRQPGGEYPLVQEAATAAAAARPDPNPATGVAFQTSGGAALASALGDLNIPPHCAPPPPPINSPVGLRDSAADATGILRNPMTALELPQMPVSSTAWDIAGGSFSSPTYSMPRVSEADDAILLRQGAASHDFLPQQAGPYSTAVAVPKGSPTSSSDAPHVTIQLNPILSANKMRYRPQVDEIAGDATAHNARDQDVHAAVEGWQQAHFPADDSTAAHAGTAAHDEDDADSSCAIIPPGHQEPLPVFWDQLTFRAVITGLIVGCVFVLLTMRLALVTGIVPNLQVVIAGSCWVLLRAYTLLLGRDMQCIRVLRAQEVAVALSAALAVASSAAAGGFGTVLLALQDPIVQRVGSSVPGNLPSLIWSLDYWKLVCYLLVVGLSGAMLMLAFRKLLLARPSMTFATGAAAGQLINTLHTPPMSYHGHKQMHRFAQWSAISFLFSGYQWVFNNPACNGFINFPTFGLQALKYTWNFDFQLPFVGLGILAPVSVAWSMIVGGVLTWGLLWPVLSNKEGVWFPKGLASDDVRGLYGYHLVAAMALLLTDALYHMVKGILGFISDRQFADSCRTDDRTQAVDELTAAQQKDTAFAPRADEELGPGLRRKGKKKKRSAWRREALRIIETDTLSDASALQFGMAAMERALRQHIFLADGSTSWVGVAGFVLLAGAAVAALPNLFGFSTAVAVGGATKTAAAAAGTIMYYHVLVAAVLAALVALACARGAGVTDINLAGAYTKLGVLIFSAWAGNGVGGAGAGLLCGGLLCGAASSAVNAMYAYRAGFMVMASPTAVFASHVIGLGVGCIAAPVAWLIFDSSAPVAGMNAGNMYASDGFFTSPPAAVFRSTAAIAGSGLSALPMHALWVGMGAVVVAMCLNALRDVLPPQARGLIPIPAAIGVVCLSGASVAVDLAVGAVARIVWRLRYPRSADAYALVVGCALIAGEGLWGLGRGLLAAFGVQAPICMSFSMAPSV